MTTNNDTLSHPILTPLSYEKPAVGKTSPRSKSEKSSKDAQTDSPTSEKKSVRRFLAFLRNRTRPRIPPTKIETLQGQEQREQVELLDENYTMAYDAVACLLVLMALAALNLCWESNIVKVAFMLPLITAPLTVLQRRRINKASWLREDVTGLKFQLGRRRKQNQRLQDQSDHLELRLTSLREIEREFQSLVRKQGANVDEVLQLVKEDRDITRKISQLEDSKKVYLAVKSAVESSCPTQGLDMDEGDTEKIQHLLQTIASRQKVNHNKFRMACNMDSTASLDIPGFEADAFNEDSEYEYFTFSRRLSRG